MDPICEVDCSNNVYWYIEFTNDTGYHMYFHRLDGPALILDNGDCSYYQYGKLHRLDGPAKMVLNHEEYWIDGKQIDSKEEFYRVVKLIGFL
jgi:hypothetical protein